MTSNPRKEVSCKALLPFFSAADQNKLDYSRMFAGVPYDLSYLRDKHQRIEWQVYCKILSNLRQYFSAQDFENMGVNSTREKQVFAVLFLIGFGFARTRRILVQQAMKEGQHIFNCVRYDTDFVSANRVRITLKLEEGYEFCPEFFLVTKGVWSQSGALSKTNFKSVFTWIDRGAVYDLSWGKANLLFTLKRIVRWGFVIQRALADFNETNEEFIRQYNELEESKKTLERQSALLRTAHEITKSIRQSLNIEVTLETIANALVEEARFSFAKIHLHEDIEGNDFQIEVSKGDHNHAALPTIREIIVDNKAIGELTLVPGIYADAVDMEELTGYLMPAITISIHDALVLRAVTDYRNNLEVKVRRRTSELRKAKDELSKAVFLLKEARETQNRFFTNISHEFRTPLTLILGPAQQIVEETRKDKVRENARLIQRSAKKLNRLANQLLDLAKIESGKMRLRAAFQDLVPALSEIVSTFESFAENRSIKLKFHRPHDKVMVYLDREKFEKVMSNLLSNAMKFTPKGGSIEVRLSLLDQAVEVSVADTGIGIAKDQLDRIFDRFYQVDNNLYKEFEGTGVGLSLTKELVELHKGKIMVESEEGRGATFTVTLPLGKSHLRPDQIVEAESTPEQVQRVGAVGPPEEDAGTASGSAVTAVKSLSAPELPSLLIVEDNSYMRKLVAGIMEDRYNILEASNGQDGLEKCFEYVPELVISDVMMPKLDGFQMCARLKEDQRTSHIPIILLTAKVALEDKIQALDTGADAYIAKPFEPVELKARIKNLLDQRKRLQGHFRKFGFAQVEQSRVGSVDQKFLRSVSDAITRHISDASFGVEQLADEVAVSRSLLHKKLVALVGEPPGELIRRFRLNKAAKLIEQKSGNVTEVAFEVGFNDASYFTVCFKKQFGVSPSRYHKPG